MKRILLFATMVLLLTAACNKLGRKAATPEPAEPEPEIVEAIEPDTLYQEEAFDDSEIYTEPAPRDRYYLIAASFRGYDNAQQAQSDFLNRGMNSEIIQRDYGPNSDYYRVSYMSFSDRSEALRTMRNERAQQGKETVWILSVR